MSKLALYQVLRSLWLWKLKEEEAQKQAIFDLLFSKIEENNALAWILAESMDIDLKRALRLFASNFRQSDLSYYFYPNKWEEEAFRELPILKLTEARRLSFHHIAALSPLIKYCSKLTYLTIKANRHNRYGYWHRQTFVGKDRLRELPEEIGELKDLLFLQISRMPLEHLPASIGELKQLRRVIITCCDLTALPPSFFELEQLEILVLANNKIETLPADFLRFKHLKVFDIQGNPLKKGGIDPALFDPKLAPKAILKALKAYS